MDAAALRVAERGLRADTSKARRELLETPLADAVREATRWFEEPRPHGAVA